LKLNKKLFVERVTARGKAIEEITKKTKLVVGDKVIVRIELRVDRAMGVYSYERYAGFWF
jgi:hypothetical protein